MASLWKHPSSKFWVACFTDLNGNRKKRSTRTTDRKIAQRIAEEYEAAARRKRTALQVRRVISDLHKAITGEGILCPTVRDYVADWLASKKPECAGSTYDFYRFATGKFIAWLGPDADRELSEITTEKIRAFRNAEADQIGAKTVNHHLKCLKMVFRCAKRQSIIADDPAEFVETIKRTKTKSRRPFTIDELRAILAATEAPEWKSLILFGLYTGQRLGDLARLEWSNVDLARNEIRLATSKTGKRLIIPLAQPLRTHIEGMKREGTHIHSDAFNRVSKSKTQTVGALSNQFAEILAAAGLRDKASHQKTSTGRSGKRRVSDLSFHSLRHTAVSLLKEAGIPDAVVMEIIGHDSAEMSDHYTSIGRDALTKAANAFPAL